MIEIKKFSIYSKEHGNYLTKGMDFKFPKGKIYIESEESDKIFELLFATILNIESKIYPAFKVGYDELNYQNRNSNYAIRTNIGNAYTQLSGIFQKVHDEIQYFTGNSLHKDLGLNKLLTRNLYTLSGGELQKVMVTRSLYSNPDLLLLHNQFSELDKTNKKIILEFIKNSNFDVIVYDKIESKYFKFFDYVYRYVKENNSFVSLKKDEEITDENIIATYPSDKIEEVIHVKDVSFSYNNEEKLFENLNLSFSKGLNFLLGENGSGKSTLFKMLVGIISHKKYNGKIYIYGMPIEEYFRNNNIGIAFQNPELSLFNVTPQKEFGNLIHDKNDLFAEALKIFELEDKLHVELSNLEWNEKKKITLLQALAGSPEILLFDEPTQNLSFNEKIEVKEFFELLVKTGKTIIIITHSEDFIKTFHNMEYKLSALN